ncbi:MAG: glycosyltransferase family 2 protein [Alphaproteobacteria bacterium]|nr:glycosyltransferase family 2 protein [Alphaproteobacteria bacterium]
MSTSSPRVSIVIPSYNHLHYLPRALDTALDQTFEDIEVIVVNDGSTDDTKQWLDAYNHPKLRVIHQENKRPAEAINTGIQAARGEYITWMSADNYCANYFVEAFAAALDSNPDNAFAFSPYYVIDAEDKICSIYCATVIALRELITRTGHHRGNASFMYRKSVHAEVGKYEGWTCDSDMWVRILERYKSVYLIKPVYYYRIHDAMATQTKQSEMGEASPRILQNFMQRHSGGVSEQLLARLYPALHKSPQLLPSALADLSARIFSNGLRGEALSYLKITLSSYAIDDLLRPLANFIALSMMVKLDPMAHIQEAVASNKHLTAEMKSALISTAQGIILLNGLKSKPDIFLIEHESMPLKYDMPEIFSFTAWKNGTVNTPLPVP